MSPFRISFIMTIALLLCSTSVATSLNQRYSSSRFARSYFLHMGPSASDPWQWQQVAVVSNEVEAIGLRRIQIKTSPTIAASYSSPGQYVQIKAMGSDSNPGFYAIASSPNPNAKTITESDSEDLTVTFLIKETDNNQYLTDATSGTTVDMSLAQGRGFLIEEYFTKYKYDFPVTNVLMMACGSGIAPVAAAIDSGLLGLGKTHFNSLFKSKATLYIGAKTPEHLPLRSSLERWTAAGIKVVPVYSQPQTTEGLRSGYVQHALRSDGVAVPRNTGALLCGQRGMVEEAKKLLLEAGVFEGRVLLNF